MRVERRGRVARVRLVVNRHGREEPGERTEAAGQAVSDLQVGGLGSIPEGQGQQGRGGVDEQSIEDFERDRDKNLYRIWSASSRAGGEAVILCSADLRVRKLVVACRCESGPGNYQGAR
jgi:hypothetical protein